MNQEIKERFQDAVSYDGVIGRIFPGYDLVPGRALRSDLGEVGTTVKDSSCAEPRRREVLVEAGFAEPTQVYRAPRFGAWLTREA